MNRVELIGRFTSKPELRYNGSSIAYTRFNLAVNRPFADKNGKREADFINCIAWRKTAELICNYFDKGREFGACGRIQTGSYDDKDGNKRYTTDVVIDEITFIGGGTKKQDDTPYNYQEQDTTIDPFAELGTQVSLDDNFLD